MRFYKTIVADTGFYPGMQSFNDNKAFTLY